MTVTIPSSAPGVKRRLCHWGMARLHSNVLDCAHRKQPQGTEQFYNVLHERLIRALKEAGY